MDQVIRGVMLGGEARFVLARTTELTEETRKIYRYAPVCTAAVGRLTTAAVIMSSSLKDRDATLSIMIEGGGPAGQLIAVARPGGRVKSYCSNPYVDLPLREDGKLDVGGAVGRDGYVTVIRRDGEGEPYMGKTELVSGEIGDDLAAYYTESEQTPTALALGVSVDAARVRAAGGILLQTMPDCSEATLILLESALADMGPISGWIGEKEDLSALIREKMPFLDAETLETFRPERHCDCESAMPAALAAVGRAEAEAALREQGKIEIRCHFCNKTMTFGRADVDRIFAKTEKP
ncbi:MAG: Hsp33 family molecular chaperone HslO [Eubacteriales bacterium]|nr:Hsp33 family molecular chaperone HslO [Eubacteriales bacterium]